MSRALPNEQALADRLRGEALASRPAFSEDLHARLCGAIRQCRADAARPQRRVPATQWFMRWTPAAAAACLLIVFVASWMLTKTAPDAGVPVEVARASVRGAANAQQKVDMRDMSELVGQVTAGVDGMVHFAVKAPRWACLDRNIRRALGTPLVSVPCDVVSSLLSMPSPKRLHVPAAGHS